MTGCSPDRPSSAPSQAPSEVRRRNIAARRLITAERLLPYWISVQAACRPECPSSCCAPSALLRGGSRVARTAPRQVATLTSGPCHVRCYCAPSPPATAPARPPVQVAHTLPPALHERKGNHAHNGQETTNGAQQRRPNPTANRPWFGPIPTGGDWNPAHGADPDVIDFHRYAAGEPEHIVLSSVDTLTRLNRIRSR